MTQIVLVGLGGMIGSISRFLLSDFVQRLNPILGYPFGTLTVNVLGCFLIGLLNGLTDSQQLFIANIRPFLFIGVLGGFTTYSTFGYETFAFLRDGQYSQAFLIVGLHLFLGLGAVWLGDMVGRIG
ncbi:fluoride efflux transporter CrcB [Candidatus Nitrospira salsa]|nr:MAG: putative fluoride ion transporter CrcB [Nitrospirales bacterium]